jgi:hypothetical protein
VTADDLAGALAEIAVKLYGRKKVPPRVLEAFGVLVRIATKAKAVKPPARRARRAGRKAANGHDVSDDRVAQG